MRGDNSHQGAGADKGQGRFRVPVHASVRLASAPVPSAVRVVLITHPRTGARAFARGLVERSLAACVNVVPVSSVYRWCGAVEEAREVLLVVKTRAGEVRALERHLAREHPYDVPEFVALAPGHVERRYLAWLLAESGPSAGRR